MEGDISEKFNYSRTVRMLNPYYPQRDLIFALRCTAGIVQLTYLAPFSYLTLFCPIVNEISGPKGVTHHIFYLVQKIAVVQRKKES